MRSKSRFHNPVVAALLSLTLITGALPLPGTGASAAYAVDATKLDDLLTRLKDAKDAGEAGRIEAELLIEWSKSGSPSTDVLYQRGSDALELGNTPAAIEHLTAAIDHDPDFLAAWDARATAYFRSGLVGPALADLAHVLTLEPRQYMSLTGLAVILEETGKPAQALEAYRRVNEQRPFMPEIEEAIARLEKELEGQEL